MSAKIMVVDDDADVREMVAAMLRRDQHEVIPVEDGANLKNCLGGSSPDVVLLDLKLPDADGLELLPLIKKSWPETEVVVLTGHATLEAAVEATKRGAYHFQQKPFDHKTLSVAVEKALEHKYLTEEASSLRRALSSISGGAAPVFQSPAMKAVVRTVERVAPSDVSILITGESGTGKEVVADLVHALSPRSKGPFVKINCAALPRELIESELFGSVKGAYTGAQADREGLFRQAEGGTLLLDELSEMPADTQSKLLRVLQEKEVRPVGGRSSYKMDCRVIASTNRAVEEALREGRLREDLYYRISAIAVHLPPLRERREDILPLAMAFLKRFAAQADRLINGFSSMASDRLHKFDWPGNVRQLQNEIQRAVLMCEGGSIEIHDLSPAIAAGEETTSNLTLMEAMERNTIVQMLRETQGNKLETARRLGIGRQTLYNKIKAYSIESLKDRG
ncbi:MAG TPA: sigma-54 dependent transcriptional regulator [Candidatus Paceibacterota bacterium]|nr:sigma-54 dependent transcriptional regulator [Verrucomicrobiota bacterium]HRY51225.1 sigma-54 dependent transcriptional regulator [Candidatus Paceibacterota bacterium]HSA00432.1 sigma-54 dependent transcriptional regulator [Candidatus Paceibacterota bacterium]